MKELYASFYYPIFWVGLIFILVAECWIDYLGKYETSSYVQHIRVDSVKFLMTLCAGFALPSIFREYTAGSFEDIFVERIAALFMCGPINFLVMGTLDTVSGRSTPLFWVLVGKIQYLSLFVLAAKRVASLEADEFGIGTFSLLFSCLQVRFFVLFQLFLSTC